VIIDGFAGPGVYEDGQPGSPIVMLNAYLEHESRAAIDAELVYFFIEQDARRVERLEEEIKRLGELPDNVKYRVVCGSFEEEFGKVISEIEKHGAVLAPTFAFIDPFGYTGVPMDITGRFLQFNRCEVLIYVPLKFVNRFLGVGDQTNALNALFGTDRWQQAREIEGYARIRFLHDLFAEQLKSECGLRYVRSFEIVTAARNSGYTLFFGTNHEVGLERMKAAMWRIDPVEGRRLSDSTKSEQTVLFQAEPDTRPLRAAALSYFDRRAFSIDELERFTLIETPFLPKHLRKTILKPMEDEGRLEIVQAREGRRKGTYRSGTILRFL